MILRIAKQNELQALANMSKEAFDTDIDFGAQNAGGPPEYDSLAWHEQMLNEGNLCSAIENDELVGGALLFDIQDIPNGLYIGRIFIKPSLHHKGLGIKLMDAIEKMYASRSIFYLDTPVWNTRTNSFYTKLGYTENKRDKWLIYYTKENK